MSRLITLVWESISSTNSLMLRLSSSSLGAEVCIGEGGKGSGRGIYSGSLIGESLGRSRAFTVDIHPSQNP